MEFEMEKMTYSSVKNIIIEKVKRNVYIRPWDKNEVEIRFSQEDNTDIDHLGDSLEIQSEKSLLISVPGDSNLSIENVGGNCVLYGKLGAINIEKIGGNLEISSAADANIENVGGNCVLGPISGGLRIGRVGGNLHVENAKGGYLVEKIGGNLTGFGTFSDFSCSIGGNAKINCLELHGSAVSIKAGGNVKMSVAKGLDFDLVAKCGGIASISVSSLEVKGVTKRIEERIGAGGTQLELKAGGNIKLSDFEEIEIPHLEEKPFHQEAWELLDKNVEKNDFANSSFNFSSIFNIEKEINEDVQEKVKFAEERIKAAMAKLDKKLNINPTDEPGLTAYEFDIEPKPETKTSSVSDEERMMILKMLQEKKISAEEADRLLSVLEQS